MNNDVLLGWAALIAAALLTAALIMSHNSPSPLPEVEDISAQTADGRDINFPMLPETIWSGASRGGL